VRSFIGDQEDRGCLITNPSFATKLNLFSTLRAQVASGSRNIFIHRRTILTLARGAILQNLRRCDIGCALDAAVPLPGYVSVQHSATLSFIGRVGIASPCYATVHNGAELIIDEVLINSGLRLSCYEHICIGAGTHIAENVYIRDSDSRTIIGVASATSPVHIGARVRVGTNVTILKGVRIGEGAVVAPGSLVINDVPDRALVAGVPAVIKRTDVARFQ